jgi:hypothetical protein
LEKDHQTQRLGGLMRRDIRNRRIENAKSSKNPAESNVCGICRAWQWRTDSSVEFLEEYVAGVRGETVSPQFCSFYFVIFIFVSIKYPVLLSICITLYDKRSLFR